MKNFITSMVEHYKQQNSWGKETNINHENEVNSERCAKKGRKKIKNQMGEFQFLPL